MFNSQSELALLFEKTKVRACKTKALYDININSAGQIASENLETMAFKPDYALKLM